MGINKNIVKKEMLEKAMQCKSADELIALAKTGGYEMTKEEAVAYMAEVTNRMPMENLCQGGTGPKYVPDTNLISMFLRWDNRLNRQRYIMRLLALWVVGFAITLILAHLYNTYKIKAFSYISVITFVVVLLAAIPLKVRRLHDLNRSGWWLLPVFVPIVHFLFLIYLLFWKGTEGPNQYGPDPLESQD